MHLQDIHAVYKDEPKKVFWHPVDTIRQWLDPLPRARTKLKVKRPVQGRGGTLKVSINVPSSCVSKASE